MKYSVLGQSGISVSRLCFGALTIGPLQANLSLREGAALIRYALERGVNFIDTAKSYGTYSYIREALVGWDKPVVIASKSYDYTREGMAASLDEARRELNRDCIDIFMLHEQESELTLQGHRAALEYLGEAKSKGLIRAVGVSTHTVEVVRVAACLEEIEIIHPLVNYRGLGITDGTLPEMMAALQLAYDHGKGLYGMKAIGGGNLVANVREALEFAFTNPYLHSFAVGCRMKEELDYNLAVLEGSRFADGLVETLNKVPRRLFIEEYCIGCGKCVAKCPSALLEVHEQRVRLKSEGCLLCGYCAAVCPQFAIKVI